jgi:REP element-mobilizing transposase RayT
MPDHFHLLVYVSENTEGCTRQTAQSGLTGREGMQVLTRKIGTILSSYTQAINKQESSRGSLFQPKTKAKQLIETDHLLSCFNYIHQNPLSAGLVKKLEDWQYSSFNEYFNDTPGLCNQALARELPDFPRERKDFYNHSYNVINDPLLLKFIGLSPIR